jgi:hypothetical protein
VDAECQVSPYITAIRVSLTSIKTVVQLSYTARIDQDQRESIHGALFVVQRRLA